MSNAYNILGEASKKLGFHGVCPESIAALEGMKARGFLTPEQGTALSVVLHDMEKMLGPPLKPGE